MSHRKHPAETPIERMYRKVMGHKMSPAVKCILLPKRRKPRAKRKFH